MSVAAPFADVVAHAPQLRELVVGEVERPQSGEQRTSGVVDRLHDRTQDRDRARDVGVAEDPLQPRRRTVLPCFEDRRRIGLRPAGVDRRQDEVRVEYAERRADQLTGRLPETRAARDEVALGEALESEGPVVLLRFGDEVHRARDRLAEVAETSRHLLHAVLHARRHAASVRTEDAVLRTGANESG